VLLSLFFRIIVLKYMRLLRHVYVGRLVMTDDDSWPSSHRCTLKGETVDKYSAFELKIKYSKILNYHRWYVVDYYYVTQNSPLDFNTVIETHISSVCTYNIGNQTLITSRWNKILIKPSQDYYSSARSKWNAMQKQGNCMEI